MPLGPLATSGIAAVLLAAGFVGLFGSTRSSLASGRLNPDTAKALIATGVLLEAWASFGLYQCFASRRDRSPALRDAKRP